jgi:hypothetical protein
MPSPSEGFLITRGVSVSRCRVGPIGPATLGSVADHAVSPDPAFRHRRGRPRGRRWLADHARWQLINTSLRLSKRVTVAKDET